MGAGTGSLVLRHRTTNGPANFTPRPAQDSQTPEQRRASLTLIQPRITRKTRIPIPPIPILQIHVFRVIRGKSPTPPNNSTPRTQIDPQSGQTLSQHTDD